MAVVPVGSRLIPACHEGLGHCLPAQSPHRWCRQWLCLEHESLCCVAALAQVVAWHQFHSHRHFPHHSQACQRYLHPPYFHAVGLCPSLCLQHHLTRVSKGLRRTLFPYQFHHC